MILSRSQVLKLCFNQKGGALLQFELMTDPSRHPTHALTWKVLYCAANGALVQLTSPVQPESFHKLVYTFIGCWFGYKILESFNFLKTLIGMPSTYHLQTWLKVNFATKSDTWINLWANCWSKQPYRYSRGDIGFTWVRIFSLTDDVYY